MTAVVSAHFPSPVGLVHLAVSDRGLLAIHLPVWPDEPARDGTRLLAAEVLRLVPGARLVDGPARGLLVTARRQFTEYFAGRRSRFALPLDLRAEGFSRRVLRALARIPFGQTRTYGQVAEWIGVPGAARAVGGACRRNPLPLVLPCHRVVAAGGLGGFSGSARPSLLKMALLTLEGVLPGSLHPPGVPELS